MKITKQDIKNNIKWTIFTILILTFIIILLNISTGNINKFDDYIFNNIKGLRNQTLTNILIGITNLGGTVGLFFTALITVLILFIFNKRKYGILVTLNILMSTLTYIILKNIIQRPRPPINERIIEEAGFSFPSGHSTNNMAFYGFAIYLVFKNVKTKIIRNVLCIILAILPISIGFSRIYLRVHYPSDVIAGFCLGIICVIIFTSFVYKKIEENKD